MFFFVTEYEECTRSKLGYEYNGRVNKTSSGKTCQRWDTQTPHKHIYERMAAHENYCRNPLGLKQRPFCFTTDKSTPWEYCSIPACSRFIDSAQLHLHFYSQMKNRQYVPIKELIYFISKKKT